jgi:hypothetical protein
MKKINNIIFISVFFFASQICFAQNKYGFDFIDKSSDEIFQVLKADSFWKYNGEVDDKGIKDMLIMKRGKTKLFDGYGNVKSKGGKIFEVVFYLDNNYKQTLINSLKSYSKIDKHKWKGKNNSFICFIEDDELKEAKEFGFSITLEPCDGKQR